MESISISIDIETYSDIDINKTGVYRYVDSPEFRVLLFAYSVDNGPVQLVDFTRGEDLPDDIRSALRDPKITKWAYNAAFERVCLSRFLGLPTGSYLEPEGWKCSMIWSATLGLPMGLAKVGEVLALDKQKLAEGRDLIRLFCVPDRKTGKRILPEEYPEEWERFRAYNIRDVETELGIKSKIAGVPPTDELWQEYWIDQRINDRGVEVDLNLAQSAVDMDAILSERLRARMQQLTGLDNPNSTAQLDCWLQQQGVNLDTLGKKEVQKAAGDAADERVKEVLQLRLQLAKSSVKKYQGMLRATCTDGRARGMFQFYGAMRTGRWAGRVLQLQNLPQNHIDNIAQVRELARGGNLDALEMMFNSPPDILSQLIRTAFVARKGSRFIVADFSAIEARVIAWLAGEQWRMDAFAQGKDIYCASASAMFGVPVVKHGENGHLRQKGKVAELACGYGGSVGALKAFGAEEMGLDEQQMLDIVTSWRQSSPRIVELWWAVDRAIRQTLQGAGTVHTHGMAFACMKGLLFIRLPSGRKLAYVKPRIIDNKITYEGISSNKGWARLESYGPKFVENCIAEGTQVLTGRGWVEIQNVNTEDMLWDGENWINHDGLLNRGIREVVEIDGVQMTPDHRVLTQEGWRDASSCAGLNRYKAELPDGYSICRVERQEITMDDTMRLRKGVCDDCGSLSGRETKVMRLHARSADKGCVGDSQTIKASTVSRVEVDEGPLHSPHISSLGQLWWKGDQGLRAMAELVRELLGGYVSCLQRGADSGQNRRERGLLTGELSMGKLQDSGAEHKAQPKDRYALGEDNCSGGGREVWDRVHNPVVQTGSRVDVGYIVRKTGLKKQVYDLKNAGPKHCFTVLSNAGPMIVHNCVQGIARDLLCNAMMQVGPEARICMHIHDELVIEADNSLTLAEVCERMARVPAWAEGLLLRADGYETDFYLKD